ncbi:MAG: hypothetical protein J6N95_05550 [Bacilli bacterium]|nr:hypothetical protein [Bacilli bacterium]
MDYEIERNVTVPFEYCKECVHLKITENTLYENNKVMLRITACEYRDICENAVRIWNKGKKEVM